MVYSLSCLAPIMILFIQYYTIGHAQYTMCCALSTILYYAYYDMLSTMYPCGEGCNHSWGMVSPSLQTSAHPQTKL